jgi:3-oxoacyl-[acyl-carrier protein] reductase
MDLGLAGRVAIVTGASRGIGKACAAELAAEGAQVVLLSKDANGVPHAIPIRSPSDSDMIRAASDDVNASPALSPTEDRP